ncbi:MAG: 4-diphosphocytidyl-2C-methyl-D-erythritol kinase, partial [Alphaproteobacteria bacterium]|nr:4-diphosphocytidyl-2C-methyl-D-erythritol kinase [Alphaproteobacteria bacterium]
MKFAQVAIEQSEGGIAVHSIRQNGLVLKKGRRVSADDLNAMRAAGVKQITIAQLEAGDIGEDDAAQRLAQACAGAHVRIEPPFTGRSNLYAHVNGVLVVDEDKINAVNETDERITIATLRPWQAVVEGEMIGTVKIIPYAVEETVLDAAIAHVHAPALRIAPFAPKRIGVISTMLPGLKPSTITKTLRVLEERLQPAGARIVKEIRTGHDNEALAQAIKALTPLCDILVIFGASAIADRRDVIPAALEQAGGAVVHFGMPVDPGNLLLFGRIDDTGRRVEVLGAPGCARSPKLNGFDWVLQRLLAG